MTGQIGRLASVVAIAATVALMGPAAWAQSAPGTGSSLPGVPAANPGAQSSSPTGVPAGASAGTTVGAVTKFFARNRNVSVKERARPGYEAVGVHAGGFNIFPRLTADAQYNDNIYATQNGSTADEIFHLSPEVLVKSNWNRHELDLYAHGTENAYANHSTENTFDYGVGASGRLDVLESSNLFAGGSFDKATEPRTSPNSPAAAAKPIRFDLTQVNLGGVREFDRLRLFGRVNYSDYNYFNTVTQAGAFLLQKDRNYHQWDENGRAEFAMSPEVSFYVTGTVHQINYLLRPPVSAFDRNSNGYDVAGGTSFDITRLIRGEAEVGVTHRSFADPHFRDISSPYYRVGVDWLPTQLTTVNFSGSRTIQEAVNISASSYIATTIAARIDHELLRNVILSAYGSYADDSYQQAARSDKLAGFGASATYLMNQHIGLRLAYDFSKLSSSGTAKVPSYDDNRLVLSFTFQL